MTLRGKPLGTRCKEQLAQEGLGGLGSLESGWWKHYLGDVLCQGTVEAAHRVGVELLGPANQLGQVGHRVIPNMGARLEQCTWPSQCGEPCPLLPSSLSPAPASPLSALAGWCLCAIAWLGQT